MLLCHSLLGIWLCFVLVAPQGHEMKDRRRDDRKAGLASTLLSHEHYKRLQNQLQTVRTLSRRYWHSLACGLWQENCEEDQMSVMEEEEQKNIEQERGGKLVVEEPGWGFRTVRNIMSRWYCSIGKCCATGDCRVTNNITGLEKDLSWKLHGQHLAKEVVLKALRGFLERPEPKAALALSFHGWSGTGKNFVARLIAEHLFRDGLKSDCVRVFISTLHFPYSKYVDLYKVQLAKQIRETAQQCEQSLFIFDEAEKLHVDLIEAIRPHMDFIDKPNLVDHQHSIFLFLSHVGGNIINEVALDFWRAGRSREEITMEYLEERLWMDLLQPAEEGNIHSYLLKENLVDFLVPFLPLEYHHVKLCARDAFLGHGLQFTDEAIEEVARTMMFVPKEEKLFSAQGCKSVSQRVNYFSP